jgi:D-alanyl-D-alanine carboxypeptidase (penicillin-binding protein 5/6)
MMRAAARLLHGRAKRGRGLLPALLAAAIVLGAGQGWTQDAFQTTVRNAILFDAGTESVLFEKAADEPQPPASLAKLMTLAVIFE